MNVIYINHYAGSYSQPREWRPYYLSKGFKHYGANASVITASFHHLQKKHTNVQEQSILQKDVDGINYTWLKTPQYEGNGIKRILNMFAFAKSVFKTNPVLELGLPKPDLIIISSAHPFHLLGGLRWAKKFNAKVYFEVRDAWPLSLNLLLGLKKWHPFSLWLSFFQYLGLKFTDKTIGLASNIEPYLISKGLSSGKFLYVCNGIDEAQPLSDTCVHDEQLTSIRRKYKRVLMYTGSLGLPNAMDGVIDAMNTINEDDIALIIIGNGLEKQSLIKRSLNSNVFFLEPIPKDEIQRALAYSDICIIAWQDLELYKYGVSPNKIFDYMWAKKPIIQALSSTNNHVSLSGCGVNINAQNINDIRKAIIEMSLLDESELIQLGKKGYNFLMDNFEYKILAKKILDSME